MTDHNHTLKGEIRSPFLTFLDEIKRQDSSTGGSFIIEDSLTTLCECLMELREIILIRVDTSADHESVCADPGRVVHCAMRLWRQHSPLARRTGARQIRQDKAKLSRRLQEWRI